MKTFTYKGREYNVFEVEAFGVKSNVFCRPSNYKGNDLAIEVFEIKEDGSTEYFGVLTSNLCDPLQSEDTAYVKTYSENSGWALDLASEIGEYTGHLGVSGYCTYPLFKFDISKFYGDGSR